MNMIKLVDSLEIASDENLSLNVSKDPAKAELRSLGDWELVLVSGGDGFPYWP